MRGNSGDGSGFFFCHIFPHSPLMIDIIWYNDTMIQWCMPDVCHIRYTSFMIGFFQIISLYIYIMIEKTYGYLSHSMESHGIPLKNPIESWRHVPAREHIFFQKLGFDFQAPIISGTFGGVFRRSQPSMFDDDFFGCQNDSTHLTRSVFSFRCV